MRFSQQMASTHSNITSPDHQSYSVPKPGETHREQEPQSVQVLDINGSELESLVGRFGIQMITCSPGIPIPGSYWGDTEAGLIKNRLYVRGDTPVHSALHEACHYICMDVARRAHLDTDAGGDDAEEDAVCYLQILLAQEIHGLGSDRMMADMDAWGYSFRLGSARAWFEQDAEDARAWLLELGLIDSDNRPLWILRGE